MGLPIPLECLQEIFEHLQDDLKSLYTMLFVNKLWCINTVPILYRNPFILLNEALFTTHSFKDAYDIYGYKKLLLLDIYVSYLTEKQKLEWKEKGIKLPEWNQPLLFDYLSFLRILPIPEIQHSIILRNGKVPEARKFVEIELSKLFLTHCKNIHTLILDESSTLVELPELTYSLPNFYNLNFICSKLLNTPPIIFHDESEKETSKLEKIIPHCGKIKVLSILRFGNRTPTGNKQIISRLISKPRALERFYWESVRDYDESSIAESLEKHINSLSHIEIYTFFSPHIISLISKCKNLVKLRFAKNFNNIPQFISDDDKWVDKLIDITPFTYPECSFNHLQELFFGGIPTDFSHFEILLKKTNHCLKKLGIGWSNSINLLNLYCQNLNTLNLKLSFTDFNKFFKVSELPKSLTKLIFSTPDHLDHQLYHCNIDEFFSHLGNIITSKIKYIHLGMFYKLYSDNSLSNFLIICQEKLKFPLELILPFDCFENGRNGSSNFTEGQNFVIKNFTRINVLSENSWILFLYFYLDGCRNCPSCNGRLLNAEEDNPIEPFKEIVIVKHCSCWNDHIERLILNLNEDANDGSIAPLKNYVR